MTRVSKHFLFHDVNNVAFTSSFVVTHSSEDDTISPSPYLFLVISGLHFLAPMNILRLLPQVAERH